MLNGALNTKQSLPICMSNGFRNNTCYRLLTTVEKNTVRKLYIYSYIQGVADQGVADQDQALISYTYSWWKPTRDSFGPLCHRFESLENLSKNFLLQGSKLWDQESLAQTFVFTTGSYNLKCNNTCCSVLRTPMSHTKSNTTHAKNNCGNHKRLLSTDPILQARTRAKRHRQPAQRRDALSWSCAWCRPPRQSCPWHCRRQRACTCSSRSAYGGPGHK